MFKNKTMCDLSTDQLKKNTLTVTCAMKASSHWMAASQYETFSKATDADGRLNMFLLNGDEHLCL